MSRRISVGDLYREMARQRAMTALQLNLHAELDDVIDGTVDVMQREIAESGERVIADSRLAWFFFTKGFKVHLITDPTVAARRCSAGRPTRWRTTPPSKRPRTGRAAAARERAAAVPDFRYHADKHNLREWPTGRRHPLPGPAPKRSSTCR